MRHPALIMLCAFGTGLLAQDSFIPARYQAGTVPPLPALAVGGGQVLLELAIDREGRVAAITPLRTTPPFTQLVADAVRDWHFSPAKEIVKQRSERGDERELQISVETKVLVAGVFRRPAINAPTLGELPRDVASPSTEVAFPLTMTEPPFPPRAFNSGVVLVQARVDRDGRIGEVDIIGSTPPFDDAVRTALREWTFRPAILHAVPTSTFVYLVFGFSLPVVAQPESRAIELDVPQRGVICPRLYEGRAKCGIRKRLRDAPGARPVVRLNRRLKTAQSSWPTRQLISSTSARENTT